VIQGRPDAPIRIALSLVHSSERIDIPVRDILRIEALAEQTFFFSDTRTSKTYQMPHVEVAFKPQARANIYKLTSRIIDEPLDIVVAKKVISRPVVREALGMQEAFNISVYDMEQAEEIAAKLRKGWVIPNLRVVE
jgi:preprotein translocase subunit SecD